jgi:hypothetical protein
VAGIPATDTLDVPVRFVPLIVTMVPPVVGLEIGVNEVISGVET